MRIDSTGAVFNEDNNGAIDFRVESQHQTHALFVDANTNIVSFGEEIAPGMDISHWVSGSTTALKDGSTTGGVAGFGGDVVISGSLRAKLIEVTHHQYAESADSNKNFIPWYGQSEFDSVGTSNSAIMPLDGRLKRVVVRSTAAAGNTIVGIHLGPTGVSAPSDDASETSTANMVSADTAYSFNFTGSAHYMAGELISVSVDPTNNPGNTYVTCIFENDAFGLD